MCENKKKLPILLGILFIAIVLTVGVTYALWQITLTQTETNHITAGCFKVEFTDKNPIQLENAFPILDEDGASLTPYEFTITNTCDNLASFQINLEVLEDTTLTDLSVIKTMLNERGTYREPKLLTKNEAVEKTLENASSAYKLEDDYLNANEEKTFEFRLWLDEDTLASEEVMNKTLNTKITVTTSYLEEVPKIPRMLRKMDAYEEDAGMWDYEYSDLISKIVIQNELNPVEGAIQVFDESALKDGSVMSYIVLNVDEDTSEETYTAYLQSTDKIILHPDSSNLFSYFYEVTELDGLKYLDTSNVTDMSYMFEGMASLIDLDLSSFDTSKVTNMSGMFSSMESLTSIDLSNFDTRKVTDMSYMFEGMASLIDLDLSSFDTSKVTNMSGLFSSMESLTSLDLSNFDTSNVTDMSHMFSGMSGLTNIDLGDKFDTSNVTDMSHMFQSMESLANLDLSNFDTSNVTNMSWMFLGMSSLTTLNFGTRFDTSNVTNMSWMFKTCESLIDLNLSSFDTTKVTDMQHMFYGMSNLKSLNLSSFNTSNVEDMRSMFYKDSNLSTINYGDNFIYKSGSSIKEMFINCPANHPTHESWNGVSF